MDDGSLIDPEVLEMAFKNGREHRDDMALWLALQVMMTDDVALADEVLVDRLCAMQDRIENMVRARICMPDRDAGHSPGVDERE